MRWQDEVRPDDSFKVGLDAPASQMSYLTRLLTSVRLWCRLTMTDANAANNASLDVRHPKEEELVRVGVYVVNKKCLLSKDADIFS